jgi:hypothetical protein
MTTTFTLHLSFGGTSRDALAFYVIQLAAGMQPMRHCSVDVRRMRKLHVQARR